MKEVNKYVEKNNQIIDEFEDIWEDFNDKQEE